MIKLRKKDFKLGTVHGKLIPEPRAEQEENSIRNLLFYRGNLKLNITQSETVLLRIIGYEVPLKKDQRRNNCIDLLAYDKKFNLYSIKLKDGNSSGTAESAGSQIKGYTEDLKKIKMYVEKEFKETFFIDKKFNNIILMVLSEKRFYENQKDRSFLKEHSDIIFAYFARTHNILETLKKHGSSGAVGLALMRK